VGIPCGVAKSFVFSSNVGLFSINNWSYIYTALKIKKYILKKINKYKINCIDNRPFQTGKFLRILENVANQDIFRGCSFVG